MASVDIDIRDAIEGKVEYKVYFREGNTKFMMLPGTLELDLTIEWAVRYAKKNDVKITGFAIAEVEEG
jgi:hypothetical protein